MTIVRAEKMDGPSRKNSSGVEPMMKRVASLALLAGAVVMSYAASAAPTWDGPGKPRPMFGVMKNSGPLNYPKGHAPAASLQTWSGGFTDLTGRSITYKMA